MYQRIKTAPLIFPLHQGLSQDFRNLVSRLLDRNPYQRIGGGSNDYHEIKKDIFFASLNWANVEKKDISFPKLLTDLLQTEMKKTQIIGMNENATAALG